MIAVSLAEIVAAIGSQPLADGGDFQISHVTTDSRQARDGSLFVALPGSKVDGADFVNDALSQGATAAVTSATGNGRRIVVDDPMKALLEIGGLVRARSSARVVAITGSNGKTLTKDFTAAGIATQRRVVASAASFNNEIGVPLTLCSLEHDTEVLVAEVGSRGVGHIASLGQAISPDISVVLNIGEAHLGEFGDLETTARAKCELVQALGEQGTAVLSWDDPRTRNMIDLAPRAVTFGVSDQATIRIGTVALDNRARATVQIIHPNGKVEVALPLPGEHLIANAAAALAVTYALGLDLEQAAQGISAAATSGGRTNLVEAGSRLILDDSYNANPASVRAALRTLAHLGATRPTWAVLGEMAELGDASVQSHDEIGRLATRLGISHIVAIGDVAAPIARAATLEGMLPTDVHQVAEAKQAIEILAEHAEDDAAILVKASRVAKLEAVVAALLQLEKADS